MQANITADHVSTHADEFRLMVVGLVLTVTGCVTLCAYCVIKVKLVNPLQQLTEFIKHPKEHYQGGGAKFLSDISKREKRKQAERERTQREAQR